MDNQLVKMTMGAGMAGALSAEMESDDVDP
jgi:hypothetical protein